MNKKFYETPDMEAIELKLQGMICVSGFDDGKDEYDLGGGGSF